MISIQTNVSALNAEYNLNQTSNSLQTSMQRLSSGYRINSAADDAAGLAISEQITAQIGGLNQASQNAQDGISMIQTADGGLSQIQSMMQRMRDLAVQGASDTNSQSDRQNINLELQQLQQEIDSIATTTAFNGQSLLNGTLTGQQASAVFATAGSYAEMRVAHALDYYTGTSGGTGTAGGAVTAIDVSGAQGGTGYEFSTSTVGGGSVTLTQINSAGGTTGASQTLSLASIAAGGAETLNFSSFGVSVSLAASSALGVSDLETDFSASQALSIRCQLGERGRGSADRSQPGPDHQRGVCRCYSRREHDADGYGRPLHRLGSILYRGERVERRDSGHRGG